MNRLTNNTDALHFLEREEPITLAPWEISEIVKNYLADLPEGTKEHTDEIFDLVYEAISEALDKSRGFVK